MSNAEEKKSLQELDLLDRFLFSSAIEDRATYEAMLEVLLGEDIDILTEPQTEKEFRTSPWLRSIRVDVYSMDDLKRIFSSEAQKKNTGNLPKRSRYYESLIDSSLLEPGSKDFNKMNDVILIMITPFDLFGYGKYRYTFQMQCKEVPELSLNDGATRIFFNTRGENKDEVSGGLIELLDFMEHTTARADKESKNEKIRIIQNRVKQVKASEKMGVRYMQKWEELAMMREEGREEGRAEGRAEGHEEGRLSEKRNSILELLEEKGRVPQEVKERILEEKEMDILKAWLKVAARVDSLEEFSAVLQLH